MGQDLTARSTGLFVSSAFSRLTQEMKFRMRPRRVNRGVDLRDENGDIIKERAKVKLRGMISSEHFRFGGKPWSRSGEVVMTSRMRF